MPSRIDLHVHSKYSQDNESEPEESIIKAIELKLHGIAFTEHYSYEASEPIERLKKQYKDRILVFRGVEFSAAEGHCLIFGADTDKLSINYAPVAEIIRVVIKAGGVVIPSHPFRKVNSIGDIAHNLKGITALEGCNGCNMPSYNTMAIEAAKSLNLPYTGGSDAHYPKEVGSCFTEFSDEVTADNLIEMLKSGKYHGVDTRRFGVTYG